MLIPTYHNQKGIFERIIRSNDGRLLRVYFEVYEVNGELKGRILNAEPVLALARAPQNEAGYFNRLSGNVSNTCTLLLCAPAKILSPYFFNVEKKITAPFSAFDLFSNIKIRAPSL
jgi:hypothetical protein